MTAPGARGGEGPGFCPHCGYDLALDAPITIGDAHFDCDRGLFWRGQHIHLTRPEFDFCKALIKAEGRVVSRFVLVERLGLDTDFADNMISIYAHRVRGKLGEAWRVETVRGRGYRWRAEAPVAEAA